MGDRASFTTEVITCDACLAAMGHALPGTAAGRAVAGVVKAYSPEGTALALYKAAAEAKPCHDVRVVALLDDGRTALVTAKAGGGADLDWPIAPAEA